DTFLRALADGGFQVEEYARLHYPGGILLDETLDYETLAHHTQVLLQQQNVVLYEAAFLHDNLFIRTDIVVKKGNYIKLIEVKSKTYDPDDDYLLVGKKGGLVAGWKPYIFDLTFQKYVMSLCHPEWAIDSYFMLANKTKLATIDGLNQNFKISKDGDHRTGIIIKEKDFTKLGDTVLGTKNVTDLVESIINGDYVVMPDRLFLPSVQYLVDLYINDEYADVRPTFKACKSCEFKASEDELNNGLKSGFKECFEKKLNWKNSDFLKPNILDVWDYRSGEKAFAQDKYFKEQLTREDIGFKENYEHISRTERQWIQIEKSRDQDTSYFLMKDELAAQMSTWKYPLNFIDFETNTVALPFHSGRRPYESIAFQYSHHILYKDGRVEHAAEYINSTAGEFPNFEFIRNLKADLEKNSGSIFRYSNHENTILNAIYFQLLESDEGDKVELMEFIQTMSHNKKDSAIKWKGDRDMIDQWDIIKKYYYNPLTNGSNSLKDVLPAILATDEAIQTKYAQPIGSINVTSLNFDITHIWLTKDTDGEVINPYKMLPPVFDSWTEEEIELTLSEMDNVGDGGAAMIAYAKLQFAEMNEQERQLLSAALLRYCELDTLAMVMVHEHFVNIT
ncbi:MAG: DUF2779 domain-containing protein, partial [Saprospiraceae bacterium]|nr:DUF2779 domain-containing protein [Saprospiraceae bacterium]